MQAPPDGYVLDAIEAAARQDASLLFRHACHHASCGSCGVRINGREALPCITPLKSVENGRAIRIEPLRNFPIIGDVLVDIGPFLRKLDQVELPPRRDGEPVLESPDLAAGIERIGDTEEANGPKLAANFNRLENCIECGLCVSACPVAGRDAEYAGPALLAAVGRIVAEPRGRDAAAALSRVDQAHGLWRCHAAFECSEVCPSSVDPAREIMGLRSRLLRPSTNAKPKGKA